MGDVIEKFSRKLVIDKNAMDEELERQAAHYYEISAAFSDACAERDTAKLALENLDATLSLEIRRAAAVAEEKVTEGNIKDQIQATKKRKEAAEEYMDLCKHVEDLRNLKDAWMQRSHSLRNLVELYGAEYWSGSEARAASTQRNEAHADDYKRRRLKQRGAGV